MRGERAAIKRKGPIMQCQVTFDCAHELSLGGGKTRRAVQVGASCPACHRPAAIALVKWYKRRDGAPPDEFAAWFDADAARQKAAAKRKKERRAIQRGARALPDPKPSISDFVEANRRSDELDSHLVRRSLDEAPREAASRLLAAGVGSGTQWERRLLAMVAAVDQQKAHDIAGLLAQAERGRIGERALYAAYGQRAIR